MGVMDVGIELILCGKCLAALSAFAPEKSGELGGDLDFLLLRLLCLARPRDLVVRFVFLECVRVIGGDILGSVE